MVSQKETRDRIRAIAAEIKFAKEKAQKPCVLLLGAGASISSGVLPTNEIAEKILTEFRPQLTGDLWSRWDRLWETLDPNRRAQTLKPYLETSPSNGYGPLADLIRDHYFTTIITLNFDRLLVMALIAKGQQEHRDFGVVARSGVENDKAVVEAMQMTDPPVKILQVHAGLGSQGKLLFSRKEMFAYPAVIENLLRDLTKNDVLTVGCAFKDLCVVKSFEMEGGKIFCVNPAGIPDNLSGLIEARNSKEFAIDGDDYSNFDNFFAALYQDLKTQEKSPAPHERPEFNPFKFLENYGPNDRDAFYGREEDEKKVTEYLFRETPQKVIHVVGPPKVGKTSFIRARLLPGFDKKPVLSVYLRYPMVPVGKLEEWLPEALEGPKRRPTDKQPTARFTGSLEDTIKKLAKDANKESKQVVVVLDDFDRLLAKDAETDRATLVQLADLAAACEDKNLSFLCVATYDVSYLQAIDTAEQWKWWLRPFKQDKVKTIIQKLAARADIQFDEEVIDKIVSEYATAQDDEQHPFSMAHVQALCHLLADRKNVDNAHYEEIKKKQGRGLNAALNVKEFFSSLEDLPDEGRNLLRKVVKFIEGDSKQHIARCLQEHRKDLLAA
jgi:hypothetical protein